MPSARVTRFLLSENRAWSGGDLAAVDLLLQQRMVARQLLETLTAQPVAARVADMGNRYAVAMEHSGDHGRAHAGALRPALRRLVDALVGRCDLLLQQQCRVGQPGMDVDLRQVAAGDELRQQAFLDHADRDAARNLARVVAAHAVGEDRETGDVDENRVFVVRADHARDPSDWRRRARC